jgi:methanogenic corrinoid protein MtbC1
MGRGAQAPIPQIDRHSLRQLETHFVAPDIYRRGDLALRQSQLAQMVADRVIPQLLRLHDEIVPEAPSVEAVLSVLGPNRGDIAGLADIVLGDDLEAAVRYVIVLRDRGLSMETLFIELLEPTARHLGEMWDNDACDFIGVTLGVARLQKLLAAFNDTHVCDALDMRRTVLMAMTPGDQHFFGVTMVERFLEASGWKVQTETAACAEEIADAARTRWFAVAGLTAGSTQMIDSLSETIALIRKRSQNPHIGIMVGGPLFAEDPSLVAAVGADATATSAPTAVLVAQKLSDAASVHLN